MKPLLYQSPENCCGCRACSNICPKSAITFKEDKYGFLFPEIDDNLCIGCGRCKSVCAFQNSEKEYRRTPVKGYAAVLKDAERLKKSASGGVFWAIAKWVIDKGGCVFGVVWDAEMNPIHSCAETIEQLEPMQGSKYVQSNVGNTYKRVAEEIAKDRWVLFTGSPCQVAALRHFLGNKNSDKLITIDIVCHGVPNNVLLHRYVASLEKQYKGKVVDLRFRHKRPDWLNGCISVKIKKGEKYITRDIFHLESIYFTLFTPKNKSCRQSCAECKYSAPVRVGDMTMGDFWGFENAGIKMKYNNGLSCLLVNNDRMLPLLKEFDLAIQEVPIETIINGNAQLQYPYYKDASWDIVMDTFANEGYEKLYGEFISRNSRLLKRIKMAKLLPPRMLSIIRKLK